MGQLDLLKNNNLAHPSFDTSMPREAVLVLTGRLVGNAPLAAQDYVARARERGETPLAIWDRERLLELLVSAPDAVLARSVGGPLLGVLAAIDDRTVTESHLENFSRFWLRSGEVPPQRAAVEAALVANRLRQTGRLDLAAMTGLCLIRAVWASVHGATPSPQDAPEIAEYGKRLFVHYAASSWQEVRKLDSDALAVLNASGGRYVTYRVTCLRLLEMFGLLAVADSEYRNEVSEWLERFVSTNPGAAQPVSDRWAISLIPAALALASRGADPLSHYLGRVASWTCDFYEGDGIGLAPADADPAQEVDYLLGGSFEHISRPVRRLSYIATVVLDLAAALELPQLYDDARNDFLAVEAVPAVPLPRDDDAQYQVGRADVPLDTSPNYASAWANGDLWKMAPHHDEDLSRYFLGRIERSWDHLAICCVTRDRHWVAAIRVLARP